NKALHRPNRRPFALNRLARRRFGVGQRLSHHPPMHSQLVSYPSDRPDPELVLPSNLFKQLHFDSPLHPRASRLSAACSVTRGWGQLTRSKRGQFTLSKSEVVLDSQRRGSAHAGETVNHDPE